MVSSQPEPPASTSAGGCSRPCARLDPAADQAGHVLARLERAEEGDVGLTGQPEPGLHARPSRRRSARGRSAASTPWWATSMRVASASSSRTSSSRVALLGATTRAARRSAVRVADAEEGALDRAVQLGLGEEGRVVQRDDDRDAAAQRHRVVRRVQDAARRPAGDQRQPGLLPRQPGRPVRDRPPGRATTSALAARRRVALGVGALARRSRGRPRAAASADEQPVDVAPDAAPVGGDGGRVDQDAQVTAASQGELLRSGRAGRGRHPTPGPAVHGRGAACG